MPEHHQEFLFESRPVLPPGHSYNDEGQIIDPEGNVWDPTGTHIIKEKPSDDITEARKKYPNANDGQIMAFVRSQRSKQKKHKH